MQTRTLMTIAVLNGNEAGKVLRSSRTRLSIGASDDNDLVLRDIDVAPFHFTVIIEGDSWRAEPVSSSAQIVVDRRWAHPGTRKKGAMVYAAGTELLLYPGDLDDAIILRELKTRKTGEHVKPIFDKPPEKRSSIQPPAPPSRRSLPALPPLEDAASDARTETLSQATRAGRGPGTPPVSKVVDPLLLSSMPTIGDAPIKEILAGRGRIDPQVTLISDHPRPSVSAWDRASRGRPSMAPEVLGVPESQMMPGAQKSVVDAVPVTDDPPTVRAGDRPNRWGDARRASSPPPRASIPPNPPSNAWNRPSRPAPQVEASASARAIVPYGGPELSIAALESRSLDPALAVLRDPDGALATAIRLFVTRLLDLERSHGYRAYMLTSAEPLTGKTTVALNLAFALAEDSKRRIALIEADFRNPRIGEILDLPPELGLLGVLEGRLSVAQASVRVADRNLVVFPSGGKHNSPAEVLASPRFKTVIQELAQSVDVAIIDAPPVKPTADANLLLPLVDGAMLVVLNGETRGGWIEQAVDQLGVERVLGAIYNNLDKNALKALAPARRDRLASIRGRP